MLNFITTYRRLIMSALETNYTKHFNAESTQRNSKNSSNVSAVTWSAIFAGTVATSALTLVLMILGLGLGMSSISLWSGEGISANTLGITAIVWLAFTHLIAHGMGGYLAGRLRTKWVTTHTDEVFFRDTAHGFLSWALASLLFATIFSTVAGSIIGATAKAGGNMLGGAATSAFAGIASTAVNSNSSPMQNNLLDYLVNDLFRQDMSSNTSNTNAIQPNVVVNNSSNIAQVINIFATNSSASALPAKDLQYVSLIVAQQTKIPFAEANLRVAKAFAAMQEKITDAKNAAEKARVVTANTALWFFIFLMIGAFSASYAATLGGKWRDEYADL